MSEATTTESPKIRSKGKVALPITWPTAEPFTVRQVAKTTGLSVPAIRARVTKEVTKGTLSLAGYVKKEISSRGRRELTFKVSTPATTTTPAA